MNARIYLLFIFFALSSGSTLYAQSLNAYLKAADKAFVQKDYYSAFHYYETALEFDENQLDVWYKYAESARMFDAYTVAENAYKKVIEIDTATVYPLSAFWLGMTQQKLGKFDESNSTFEKFASGKYQTEEYYSQRARKGMHDTGWAIEVINEPEDVNIKHLGEAINTPYSEFGAYLKGDTLYYSSFRFVDKKDKNNPPRPYVKVLSSINEATGELLPGDFNDEQFHTAYTAFNTNHSQVYYTICDYEGLAEVKCEIYRRSVNPDGSWGEPERLPDYINQPGYTNTQPNIAFDETSGKEWLLFSSDRPGGKGKLDILHSVIEADGTLSRPLHLQSINTNENDISPFFHQPSQTLFFSSEGWQGLGGYDIYKSKKSGQDWQEPEHLGYPLNSSYDDFSFILNPLGAKAYFSSNRLGSAFIEEEKEACCNDLYAVEYNITIDLLVATYDLLSHDPLLGVTLQLFEMTPEGEKLIGEKNNQEGNDFHFKLERGKEYKISGAKEGYLPSIDSISLTTYGIEESKTLKEELFLQPLSVDLEVFTFDDLDKEPLLGVEVELIEILPSGERKTTKKKNEEGNDFLFKLDVGKKYLITASRPGFELLTNTIEVNTEQLKTSTRITKNLYLKRISWPDLLPLVLYFDNDIPDKRSRSRITNTEYLETLEPYFNRKEEYIEKFVGVMENDTSRFIAGERMENFFEREIFIGFNQLKVFSKKLLIYLQRGNQLEIELQGYTSPRASASYNDILSERRINSLKNYFYSYQDGIMVDYIESGKLTIKETPFGEQKAPQNISDKLYDEANSIFSIGASLERRVEIIEVKAIIN